MTDFETSLGVLTVLCDALTAPTSLDEGLERITAMTGDLMQTGQTVALLRNEARNEMIVRNQAGFSGNDVCVGHPLRVPERLKRILWRVRSLHQINWVDSGIEDIGFPILVAPLRMNGTRVGLLFTGQIRDGVTEFDQVRRRLFTLVAAFAALIIENGKAHDYLRQQFAQRSHELAERNRLDANGGDETRQLVVSSLTNPEKVVKLLAESFYKELRRAGFAGGHITTAAARMLECITHGDLGDGW